MAMGLMSLDPSCPIGTHKSSMLLSILQGHLYQNVQCVLSVSDVSGDARWKVHAVDLLLVCVD